MKPSRIWIAAALALACVWAVVSVVMHQTDPLVSWPEKVIALAEEAPWLQGQEMTHEARQQYLDKVITSLIKMDFGQRKRTREDGEEVLEKFFQSLTEEEQKEYVNRTVKPHLDFIGRAMKNMGEEDRKRFTTRLKADLKNAAAAGDAGDPASEADRQFMAELIAEDPVLFLQDAPLKVKMKLAPMIEDMQSRVQGIR